MACKYTINLNVPNQLERQIILPSYSLNSNNFSWEGFVKDLLDNETNKTTFQDLVISGATALQLYKLLLSENPDMSIPAVNTFDALTVIKANLQTLGVQMKILQDSIMDTQFGQNVNAAVKDGIVYVRKGTKSTAPMHELTHLVFAVMKTQDPEKYVSIMDKVSTCEAVNEELLLLPAEYSEILPSEQIEEALVRVIEKLLDKEIDATSTVVIDGNTKTSLWDFLNEYLKEDIKKTFGLQNIPSVALFLQSKFKDLPLQGSNWFIKEKIKTTGYGALKLKAILGARVLNYILNNLAKGENPIIEMNCV